MRACKRRLVVAEADGDEDIFVEQSIRLRRLRETYADFSHRAHLPTQHDRAQVLGYGRSISGKTVWAVNQQKAVAEIDAKLQNAGLHTHVTAKISNTEYAVERFPAVISGLRQHAAENIVCKPDRAAMTQEKAQEFIEQAKLVVFQSDRETIKFLAAEGYSVINLDQELITAVPQKWRKKYDRFVR